MDIQKQGGPAFPTFMKESAAFGQDFCQEGMTLRDWFAGQALVAIIQADGAQYFRITKEHAETAYAKADAMIAERSKP